MTFYKDPVVLVNIGDNYLYLFKHMENRIIMEYYDYKKEENKKLTLAESARDVYDVSIENSGGLNLIYQDETLNLHLLKINGEDIEEITLTEGPIEQIYELNIFNVADELNIIYLTLLSWEERTYNTYHHFLQDEKWNSNVIESIKANEILNPIKLIKHEEDIILAYYYEDQICMKELDYINKQWKETTVLTHSNAKKLYLDIIIQDDCLHLTYCEYKDDNLVIKYEKYIYNGNSMIKDRHEFISNEGNPSNPTLLYYGNVLWIVWNESNRLMSRYSEDMGKTWSSIYLWKESLTVDFVRYKYIEYEKENNFRFDYSFGSINPEIKFLGFGPLKAVEEIPLKKKMKITFPQL